jgi:hypothetical protein
MVGWTKAACSAWLFCCMPITSFLPLVAIWPDNSNSSNEYPQQSIVCVKFVGGSTASVDTSNSWNVTVLVATSTNQVYSIPIVVIATNERRIRTVASSIIKIVSFWGLSLFTFFFT